LFEQITAVGLYQIVNASIEVVLAVEFGVFGDLLVDLGFFLRDTEQAAAGEVGAV
jgi:TctA family transporter